MAHHALLATSIPQTFHEAHQSPKWPEWQKAITAELDKMEQYKVWDMVERTPNTRALKAKWVFTRKVDGETGKAATFKARWVAKGFSQVEGVDYNELYAGVAHKDSIRVFLSLINHLDLECDQVASKRHSSTATSRRQSTSNLHKAVTSLLARCCSSASHSMASSNRRDVSIKH